MTVYFFVDLKRRWCKIGLSRNPRTRLRNVQTSMPFLLESVLEFHGSHAVEKGLHRRFKHLRIRGEWYSFGPELAQFVAERTLQENS